jgi:hypothetical protein
VLTVKVHDAGAAGVAAFGAGAAGAAAFGAGTRWRRRFRD